MRKLNQKGSFIVWFTLSFALLGTFIGFALDFGRAYLQKARIARLVDGAAIVAAKVVKGQTGNEAAATRAACDSMKMNGAPVEMSGATTCTATSGAPFVATISYLPKAVQGGPPIIHVTVTGDEPVPTTFLRFLGWMVPGDYSTINVRAVAEAAPERPIDLVIILDRSGSMSGTKIAALKNTVNEFLDNNFTGNDRIAMVSFAWRGCGNSAGGDNFSANICQPDVAMDFATTAHINTLKARVNILNANGATNTMEALRTARPPIQAAFNDATRAATRKVVLLVTDGKPTAMRRDTDAQCRRNPKTGTLVSAWNTSGTFTNGCLMDANDPDGGFATRSTLANGNRTNATGSTIFLNTISCFRAFHDCDAGTNGVLYEADLIRNCGAGNSGCTAGGEHDVLFFAIGIGTEVSSPANASFDKHAKCMLLRSANGTELLNTGNNTVQSINTLCTPPPPSYDDGDTYAELRNHWPSCTGPCINSTQEKGKVYFVDQNGNVQAQMQQVFNEIAAILRLRLTL
jgi:Flp pilus assembly protein TadG